MNIYIHGRGYKVKGCWLPGWGCLIERRTSMSVGKPRPTPPRPPPRAACIPRLPHIFLSRCCTPTSCPARRSLPEVPTWGLFTLPPTLSLRGANLSRKYYCPTSSVAKNSPKEDPGRIEPYHYSEKPKTAVCERKQIARNTNTHSEVFAKHGEADDLVRCVRQGHAEPPDQLRDVARVKACQRQLVLLRPLPLLFGRH